MIFIGIELAGPARIGLEDMGSVTIKVTDFADNGADQFGSIGREVRKLLGAFGLLDLWE